MKFFFLFISILFFNAALDAQDITQSIRGKVVDTQSQYPIIGANVIIENSEPFNGTTTSIKGDFVITNIPIGRVSITITSLGYQPVTLNNLVLTSAKEMVLDVSMQEDITTIGEATVIGTRDKKKTLNKMATVSARTMSVVEAGKFAGSLNDPARMAQNYAEVSGSSDDRNDIIIRGNSPLGVLWRLEGIDIPSPNHFSTLGTTGGPVSMLNLNNLANSDFMTSAWSADYGNALSGVFDLNLRNGNNQKREYLAQMGFNGLEFGAEGPFKKEGQASFLVNYRYSTLAIFELLGLNLGLGTAVPQYQDLTFKLNFPTEKHGQFSLWGIGGVSHIEFEATEEAENANLFSSPDQSSIFESQTGVFGASHKYFFNEKTFSEIIFSASSTNTTGVIDSITPQKNEINLFGFDQKQIKYAANFKLNKKINSKNTIAYGIIGENYVTDMLDSAFIAFDSVSLNPLYRIISSNKGNAVLLQSYINFQHRFNEKATLNAGLHSQHFLISDSHTIEPRLGFKYALNPRNTFNFGVGIHSQLQPIVIYFVEEQNNLGETIFPNTNLDFSKAIHTVIGHDFNINENMRLKTEVYYQHLFNIPVDSSSSSFSMLNEGAGFILPNGTGYVNEGTGQNFGAEITLEKFFSKGYYFLTTASIFDSQYEGSDGVKRNTAFNSNFVFNALGGK